MLTITLSQSGLLLCKFVNTHLFLGGERRLGQSAACARRHFLTSLDVSVRYST
jgi:hypothetical protein